VSGPLESTAEGIRLVLHVQPGASRSEVAGLHGDALKVRLGARAIEGAANRELIRYLAERLGIPRAALTLVAGEHGRRKTILARGITEGEARAKLGV
jgi:uncharacterized protein